MAGKEEKRSRKEKRKEARSEKQKLRFLSWVQHQGGKSKSKKPVEPSVESSPVEEKKPKKEPTNVKKRRRDTEAKPKSKSKFQEYLEMERGGAVSREEDLETERRLAKKLKVKKGKLGGPDDGMDSLFADLGFEGDFGSDDEAKEFDWNTVDDTEVDKKKGKKKKKKVKNDPTEELYDGGVGEENDEAVQQSENEEPNVVELPMASKAKYVPPSLRATSNSESEEIAQIRRRVRGVTKFHLYFLLHNRLLIPFFAYA
jgi:nucleolar MIF4G domain-containing protein 1